MFIKFNSVFVFQIQNLLLLVFCMDDVEYTATLNYVLFYFHLHNHQNHLYKLCISLSRTLNAFVPYGYVVILSNVSNLLSSLLLSAISIDLFSVYIVMITFKSLLRFWYFIIKQAVYMMFKHKSSFYYTFLCSFRFFLFTIIIH